jgi:hypothetical protein
MKPHDAHETGFAASDIVAITTADILIAVMRRRDPNWRESKRGLA